MSASVVKGWCPGALRPMQSGDGLVVRVRPFGGRLDAAQISGLARLAERHGNGLIDVTSRANLQIRGVSDTSHRLLLDGLSELALLDPDSDTESRRNILVTPFWRAGDTTQSLAAELEEALADSKLELPTKFGFAIDDGTSRVLAGDSADVRIERDRSGGLLVRADGDKLGRSVARGEAVTTALALAPTGSRSQAAPGAGEGGWRRIWPPVQSCRRHCSALPSRRRSWPRRVPASIRKVRWSASPSDRWRMRRSTSSPVSDMRCA
ncbi:hypothetical protein ACVWWP_005855 [Bradyrhizobium sp. LM3.6]